MGLLVGSMAALPLLKRAPQDADYIIRPDEMETFVRGFRPNRVQVMDESHVVLFIDNPKPGVPTIVELELAWPGSTGEQILVSELDGTEDGTGVASLYTLYWLKMSHRFKKNSPHFEKTRSDILAFRQTGIDVDTQPTWYKQREKETYSYSHPNLQAGQSKGRFFGTDESGTGMGGGVTYYFNHDWVHEVVSRMFGAKVPAYTLYQKDGEAVACDVGKFNALPFSERLRGVMEEATVLALERSQIPARRDPTWVAEGKKPDPAWSYKYALQKVCTSITSGWFREFAWEHYDEALADYVENYAEIFWKAAAEPGY